MRCVLGRYEQPYCGASLLFVESFRHDAEAGEVHSEETDARQCAEDRSDSCVMSCEREQEMRGN